MTIFVVLLPQGLHAVVPRPVTRSNLPLPSSFVLRVCDPPLRLAMPAALDCSPAIR